MTSFEDAANIFNEDEDILEDEDLLDDEEEDESSNRDEDDSGGSSAATAGDHPPPSSYDATQVTVAVPDVSDLHLKQQQQKIVVVKKPAILDESRKLFQRLWTDDDEIELLRGFLQYTSQRGGPNTSFNHHHHDTTAFYDQIRDKFQLDFNKNQLVEKLRRLKKKYRNVINRFGSGKEYAFKSPHDQATFEISSKIWGSSVGNGSSTLRAMTAPAVIDEDDDDRNSPNFVNFQSPNPNGIDVNSKTPQSKKRNRTGSVKVEEKQQHAFNSITNYNQPPVAAMPMVSPVIGAGITGGSVSSVVEETIKSCLSPLFKELLGNAMNSSPYPNGLCCAHGFGMAPNPIPLGFPGVINGAKMSDAKWRNQHILELEVFSKRLELMQDQIKEHLQELGSTRK